MAILPLNVNRTTQSMNQTLEFILLIVVTMSIGGVLVIYGTDRFAETAMSYHDFAEQAKVRSGQSIAVTYLCQNNSTNAVSGTMVNTGLHDIEIFAALADGTVLCTNGDPGNACPGIEFALEHYGTPVGNAADPFVPEQIANFTTGTEPVTDAMRLVTTSGKLFPIPVSNVTATC